MANVTEHFIPSEQLDLLCAYTGTTHDMLSFDAEFRASVYHDAFLGTRRLILPDQHFRGSEPFEGDSTIIEPDWHQRDSDDHHTFVISRQASKAQPTASDWVRPVRVCLGAKLSRIEVFTALGEGPDSAPQRRVVLR